MTLYFRSHRALSYSSRVSAFLTSCFSRCHFTSFSLWSYRRFLDLAVCRFPPGASGFYPGTGRLCLASVETRSRASVIAPRQIGGRTSPGGIASPGGCSLSCGAGLAPPSPARLQSRCGCRRWWAHAFRNRRPMAPMPRARRRTHFPRWRGRRPRQKDDNQSTRGRKPWATAATICDSVVSSMSRRTSPTMSLNQARIEVYSHRRYKRY